MKTTYAYGRSTLPIPNITVDASGSISGNNSNYYFWLKARNRSGYNTPSESLELTIPNSGKLTIASTNFTTYSYEDWREIYLFINTTDNFNTSKVLLKQKLYESDQITESTLSNIVITSNAVINASRTVATINDLPTNVPTGYRVFVTALDKYYEYDEDSTAVIDSITALEAPTGRWLLVLSDSLTEISEGFTAEIYQVSDDDLISAPLPDLINNPVPIKYYIINDDSSPLTSGELLLNAYLSDKTLQLTYGVKLLGYLDLNTYDLDTTGISQVNTVITYPQDKIVLSKTLPVDTAFVIEITPNITYLTEVLAGTFINLYPKLVNYTTVNVINYWEDPVDDIASLKAIPLSIVKDKQSRYVLSKHIIYTYDEDSDLDDDGDLVLIPNSNPTTGRWLSPTISILPASIDETKLDDAVRLKLKGVINTTTITINTSTTYTIDLDANDLDYFIITSPNEDGDTTTINITATLTNNSTKAILIELRQRTGTVEFDSAFTFPGGSIPIFSGNGKTDLFIILFNKDGSGTLKKRIFMVQKDIG